MGWAVFSRHIGLMHIRQCLAKAPPLWHQERTFTTRWSSATESLVNFQISKRRWRNRNVHVGDFIYHGHHLAVCIHCIRFEVWVMYILSQWRGLTGCLSFCLGLPEPQLRDKRKYSNPRLFRILNFWLFADLGLHEAINEIICIYERRTQEN